MPIYTHATKVGLKEACPPHNSIHESNDDTNLLAVVPPCKQVIHVITQEILALAHVQAL